jgi:hypothetical protein
MIKKIHFLCLTTIFMSFSSNAQNLILNGDFEAGTGNSFTNWTVYNGAANLSAETVQVHSGSRALKAIATGTTGQQYAVQLHSDNITTEIGKTYEISIWVKGATAANSFRFSTSGGTSNYSPDYSVTAS